MAKGYSFDGLVKYTDTKVARAGDTMTGILTSPKFIADNVNEAGKVEMFSLDGVGYVQTGNEETTGNHRFVLNGFNGEPLATLEMELEDNASPHVKWTSGNKKVYHEGFKPTAADVGAVSKAGDTMTGSLTVNAASQHYQMLDSDAAGVKWVIEMSSGNFHITENAVANHMRIAKTSGDAWFNNHLSADGNISAGGEIKGTVRHTDGYMNMHTFNSGYGEGRLQSYFREHDSGSPETGWCGWNMEHRDVDGNTTKQLDIMLSGKFVYHQGRKPTTSEIGALPADSYNPRRDSMNNTDGAVTIFNGDCNTMVAGDYFVVDVGSVNCPVSAADYLYMETRSTYNSVALLQTAWPYAASTEYEGEIWHRTKSNSGVWSNWRRVFDTEKPPTPAEVGAVNKAGDTMTGNLTVPKVLLSAAQGTEGNALTRKDYTDGTFVKKVGDTITGNLTINPPSGGGLILNADTPAVACFVRGQVDETNNWYVGRGNSNSNDCALYSYAYNTGVFLHADYIGFDKDPRTSAAQGTQATSLTRKDYVNAEDAKRLALSGGTMTGPITMGNAGATVNGIYGAAVILKDHGNGNVTISASKNSSGTAGDLYLGHNGAGGVTRNLLPQVPMKSAAVAGGTNSAVCYEGSTTGGANAEMWRRKGVFHSNASHAGSSYAPALSMYYLDTEGWNGNWSIGTLGASGAGADNLQILHYHGDTAGGASMSFQFVTTGHLDLPAQPTNAAHATRKDYVDNHAWTAAKGNSDVVASSYGQIGTYGFFYNMSSEKIVGQTHPGSNLRWSGARDNSYWGDQPSPTGTWKCVGHARGNGSSEGEACTLWIRIA